MKVEWRKFLIHKFNIKLQYIIESNFFKKTEE